MADADVLIRAKILYYGRERYYHQMQVYGLIILFIAHYIFQNENE